MIDWKSRLSSSQCPSFNCVISSPRAWFSFTFSHAAFSARQT